MLPMRLYKLTKTGVLNFRKQAAFFMHFVFIWDHLFSEQKEIETWRSYSRESKHPQEHPGHCFTAMVIYQIFLHSFHYHLSRWTQAWISFGNIRYRQTKDSRSCSVAHYINGVHAMQE